MNGGAARAVVERLEALPATIDGNREALAWLRGARQVYDDAERRHRPVRVIRLRDAGRQRPARHLGVAPQAAGPQGQPRRRRHHPQRRLTGLKRSAIKSSLNRLVAWGYIIERIPRGHKGRSPLYSFTVSSKREAAPLSIRAPLSNRAPARSRREAGAAVAPLDPALVRRRGYLSRYP